MDVRSVHKQDEIMDAVDTYLRRRKYGMHTVHSQFGFRSETSTNKESLTLRENVAKESSQVDSVSYSSINIDAASVDQQFGRFKLMLTECPEQYKGELSPLLFPVFIHLFLQLLECGQKVQALKFLKRYQSLFVNTPDYSQVTSQLVTVTSREDAESNPLIQEYRSSKSKCRLSEDTIHYLQRVLRCDDNMLLLQLLNTNVVVVLKYPDKRNVTKVRDLLQDEHSSPPTFNSSLNRVEDVISRVRQTPPNIPRVIAYTVTTTNSRLCSAQFNRDTTLIAGGFDDSQIRVWSLAPEDVAPTKHPTDVSQIRLSGDLPPLQTQLRPASRCQVLFGHSGKVYDVGFTPNSELLMSCSGDRTVRGWSLASFSNVCVYRGHNYPVWCLDVSELGTQFVTGSMDKTARLWSIERTYPLRIFAGHNMDVDCVHMHPNGSYVATGSSDSTVRMFSVSDGNMVRLFPGHHGSVMCVAFSPNGKYLASAGEDRHIRVWDLAAGKLFLDFVGHKNLIRSVCWSGTDLMLVSCGTDSTVKVWGLPSSDIKMESGTEHNQSECWSSFNFSSSVLLRTQFGHRNIAYVIGSSSRDR